MELAIAKPPRPIHVHRIATVGGGPAALSFLLQLKSKLDTLPNFVPYRVEVAVIEASAHFGPGQGFARAQSNACLLNFPREFMEPVADSTGNFSAWLRQVAPQCTTDYPPRRFFGLYLEQLGKRLLADSEENPRIGINFFPRCKVSGIERDASRAPFRLRYSEIGVVGDDEKLLEVDEILFCTGSLPCDNYRKFQGMEHYGHDAESNRRLLAGLRGDENIGIIGSRLSAIDLVMELRKRGHSGDITLGSLNGLLPAVSTFYTVKQIPLKDNLLATENEDSTLTVPKSTALAPSWSTGGSANRKVTLLVGRAESSVSTSTSINTRRCDGLRYLHPSLLPESPTVEGLAELFFAELNSMMRQDDSQNPRFTSYDNMLDYLGRVSPKKWLDQQIYQAERGAIMPHHVLFFQLYPHMTTLWSRLPNEEKKRYFEKFHWLFMLFYSSFPLENARRMREMLTNGQLAVMRDCKFTRDGDADGFVMEGRRVESESKQMESRRVSHLFNASGLGSNARNHSLYSKLLDSGLVRSHRFGGLDFETDTYLAINGRTKAPNPNLYIIGDMTKNQILTVSCMGVIAKQAEKVASQIFDRIAVEPELPVETCPPVTVEHKVSLQKGRGKGLYGNKIYFRRQALENTQPSNSMPFLAHFVSRLMKSNT
ncbi:hypothetical protein TWF694_009463 [Orbilia ellipsospora]|uniref:FAD-dependent urate hydroxylase HpyO/Asp monooxygenase CreE-like FAD/NAD(P)-binding domain-containing protein n=1 Tax=Orbilia ellipsospora TaxID=2528407 RepID=A0AAV9XAW8_9PEZI